MQNISHDSFLSFQTCLSVLWIHFKSSYRRILPVCVSPGSWSHSPRPPRTHTSPPHTPPSPCQQAKRACPLHSLLSALTNRCRRRLKVQKLGFWIFTSYQCLWYSCVCVFPPCMCVLWCSVESFRVIGGLSELSSSLLQKPDEKKSEATKWLDAQCSHERCHTCSGAQ